MALASVLVYGYRNDYLYLHKDKHAVPYTQHSLLKLNVKPGDMVLFAGDNRTSQLIKFVTNSKWSHVGIVVGLKNALFLFEASGPRTSSTLSMTGRTQIRKLDMTLNTYKGKVAIRHINEPLTEPQLLTLNQSVLKYLGVSYEKNLGELLKSALDVPKSWLRIPIIGGLLRKLTENRSNPTSFFCSELVSTIYRNLGIRSQDSNPPSNEFTPEDLSSTSIYFPFEGCKTFSKELEFVGAK